MPRSRATWISLEPGEPYQGVVTGFDDKKKTATVMVGTIKAELPLDNVKWARPLRDDKNPNQPRPEPTLPSRLLKHGDVVWVRLEPPAANAPYGSLPVAFLEQEPEIQGALFSMEAQTGYVLAMEGGYDFDSVRIQPRDPGAAAAGLFVQADHLRRRRSSRATRPRR